MGGGSWGACRMRLTCRGSGRTRPCRHAASSALVASGSCAAAGTGGEALVRARSANRKHAPRLAITIEMCRLAAAGGPSLANRPVHLLKEQVVWLPARANQRMRPCMTAQTCKTKMAPCTRFSALKRIPRGRVTLKHRCDTSPGVHRPAPMWHPQPDQPYTHSWRAPLATAAAGRSGVLLWCALGERRSPGPP